MKIIKEFIFAPILSAFAFAYFVIILVVYFFGMIVGKET